MGFGGKAVGGEGLDGKYNKEMVLGGRIGLGEGESGG